MKFKSLALGLMLMFFAGITTSSIASVVSLDNGIVITKVDDDKDKDKKKSKTKKDAKSCKDKKACCSKDLKSDCKDKKADPEKK